MEGSQGPPEAEINLAEWIVPVPGTESGLGCVRLEAAVEKQLAVQGLMLTEVEKLSSVLQKMKSVLLGLLGSFEDYS